MGYDVFLGNDPSPWTSFEPGEHFTRQGEGRFVIEFSIEPLFYPPLTSSADVVSVIVRTDEIAFAIVAAHSRNDWPHPRDLKLAMEYMHLDLMTLQMTGEEDFTGLLPELWGTRPLSDSSRTMTI